MPDRSVSEEEEGKKDGWGDLQLSLRGPILKKKKGKAKIG